MTDPTSPTNYLGMEPYEMYSKNYLWNNYKYAELYKLVLNIMVSKKLLSMDAKEIDDLSGKIQNKMFRLRDDIYQQGKQLDYNSLNTEIDYFKQNIHIYELFIKTFEEVRTEMFKKDALIKSSNEKIESLTIQELSDYLFNKLDDFIILLIVSLDIYPNKDCINKIKQILKTLIIIYKCWDNKAILNKQFSKINEICKEEDIKKIIDKLSDIRQKLAFDLVYPKSEISTTAIQDKIPYEDYEYSKDNDSDNEYNDDNNFNQIWKANRKNIKNIIGVKGMTHELINYGKNLILFYNNKINAVKKLLESKGMDSAKNFIGDISIQNEQREKIKDIKGDKLIAETDPQQLQNMFKNYYVKIGNQANEIMNKDYENRHKTIMYNLLIKEYELNITQINDALSKFGVNLVDSNNNSNNDINLLKFIGQSGGNPNNIQSGDNVYDIIESRKDSNIDDYFSVIMDQYNFVQNNLISNPLVISLLLEFMLKIQNAQIDPSIITEGYFNLNELTHLFSDSLVPVKIQQTILVGGGEQIIDFNSSEKDQDYYITVKKGATFKVRASSLSSALQIWKISYQTGAVKEINVEREPSIYDDIHGLVGRSETNIYTFKVNNSDKLIWEIKDNQDRLLATHTINVTIDDNPQIIDFTISPIGRIFDITVPVGGTFQVRENPQPVFNTLKMRSSFGGVETVKKETESKTGNILHTFQVNRKDVLLWEFQRNQGEAPVNHYKINVNIDDNTQPHLGKTDDITVILEYVNSKQSVEEYKKIFSLETTKKLRDLRQLIIADKSNGWTNSSGTPNYTTISSNEDFTNYQFMNTAGQIINENNNIGTIQNKTVKFIKTSTGNVGKPKKKVTFKDKDDGDDGDDDDDDDDDDGGDDDGGDEKSLYPFEEHTFTCANKEGYSGPTLQEIQSAYVQTKWAQKKECLDMTDDNGIQIWTVPKTGEYSIRAVGAGGGGSQLGDESTNTPQFGCGIDISTKTILKQGDKIHILVGQRGSVKELVNGKIGGGGGGTFVIGENNQPIIIAGGGGSIGYNGSPNKNIINSNGSLYKYGSRGGSERYGGEGGISGLGGKKSTHKSSGSGGGGFLENGESVDQNAEGGRGWPDKCLGGQYIKGEGAVGGFGGGGASGNGGAGSGGGGYSGGGGSDFKGNHWIFGDNNLFGGGGGSYATDAMMHHGYNVNDGSVFIQYLNDSGKPDDYYINQMKEQLRRSKEEAAAAEKRLAENIKEIKGDIAKNDDKINKIKENEKKAEEQEKETQEAYDELIRGIKQKMESLMDFFGKQTKSMNDATSKLIDNMRDLDKQIHDQDKIIRTKTLEIATRNLDNVIEEHNKKKCEKQKNEIDKKIIEDDSVMEFVGRGKITNKEKFYIEEIQPNFLKNNLFEFIHACDKLDSIPAWRAEISKLIVNYLMKYVADPNSINPEKPTYIANIPSYNIFNLVIMGTPGVGKSYTADIVGKVLKYSGLLTKGDRHDIKKPDIVGSYTGQTAPKVYKELTECLGKVIFIDEAYSIAGPKDEDKGTYNEFGQESLDAITDYTSEHIGLSAFVAAGYEYEMKSQFLDVNIGLPRRFPTQLILTRYGLNTFWKILESYIIKFVKKIQVDNHHRACFELLNLLFNFQCGENPIIQLSNKWSSCWKSNNIRNINVNLDIEINKDLKIKIPFLELLDFHNKVKDVENPITSETVEELMSNSYLKKSSLITKTFIKSYVLFNFCGIFNGDIFRSQADNLNKFSEYILDDKISNSKYDENKDTNYKFGHIEWIEHCYFNLYFTKNPNKNIDNIRYNFDNVKMAHAGGYKKINKKSRNNKKINKRSINNRIENNTSKLIKKINNKKEGGKPATPKGNEDEQDAPINLVAPDAQFLNPRLDSDVDPDLDVREDIEYKENLLKNFEADSIYEEGLVFYKKRDYHKAYDYFNKAIQTSKTHADSLFMLGEMMSNVYGIARDKDKVFKNYLLAAKYGNDEARFIIGHLYYYYHYDKATDSQLEEFFQKYQINLSHNDINLQDIPDIQDAQNIFVKYFTKVIDSCTLDFKSKKEPVVLLLADHYFTQGDKINAIKYLESAALKHDSHLAYINLAYYYFEIENDKTKGLTYINKAAVYGDYNIKFVLAKFYDKSNVQPENVQVYQWMLIKDYQWIFKHKDEKDTDLAKSMEYYKMAIQEMRKQNIESVTIEAIEVDYLTVKNEYETDIYKKLIASTDSKDKEDQFNIGKNFYYGENDFTKNDERGIKLIQKSAENEYSKGNYYYGKILYDKIDPCNSIDEQVLIDINKNLNKACESNLIEGIKFYANKLYTYQHILDDDKSKAAELYKKGAELGDSECQLLYASILIHDKDVLQNVTDDEYSKVIIYLHNASQNEELKSEANKLLLQLEKDGIGMKDLIFKVMIQFSDIFQVKDILIEISQFLVKDDSKPSNEINQIFENFNKDNELYEEEYSKKNFDLFKEQKYIDFIHVYILLKSYIVAFVESQRPDQRFNKESWWFFKNTDFSNILSDINVEYIMKKYNDTYHKKVEAISPVENTPNPPTGTDPNTQKDEKRKTVYYPKSNIPGEYAVLGQDEQSIYHIDNHQNIYDGKPISETIFTTGQDPPSGKQNRRNRRI